MKPPATPPADLVDAIADAARAAFSELFRTRPGDHFYYCALITVGGAPPPTVSAWSREALEAAATEPEEREMLKWSYADSPFCCFGEHHFETVRRLYAARPEIFDLDEDAYDREHDLRLDAMEAAMIRLDREGLFGRGAARNEVFVGAEVMPPDFTNTARAKRMNPPEALTVWLAEAAEPEEEVEDD